MSFAQGYTLLTMECISDEEIERNRAFEALGIAPPMDRKTEKKLRGNVRGRQNLKVNFQISKEILI